MGDETGSNRDLEPIRSACKESRAVLDHVNATLDDIADKGVWTARTAVIILGIVISAISFGPPLTTARSSSRVLLLASLAVALLFLAALLGLGLYLQTENKEGLGQPGRAAVLDNAIPREHYWIGLLRGYREWIRVMDARTDRAGTWLYLAWTCLSSSIALLTMAAVLSINGT